MLLLAVALALPLVAAASPSPSPDLAQRMEALFEPIRGKDLPGAVVVVLRGGEIVYAGAHGLADVEQSSPLTERTPLRLASVSKSFTALLALQLVAQGRLQLDESLARYVPGPSADRITIRQLLTHTSGLPDFVGLDEAITRPLEFAPGERLNYSNTGYVALGRVIGKITGRGYEEDLRDSLLAPLGMEHTGCDRREAVLPGRASGYLFSPELVSAEYTDTSADPASGGLYSTAEDMTRWLRALASGRVLAPALLQEAFSPVRLAGGRQGAYGFGFMVTRYRGLREIGHGGDISGFNAWYSIYPEVDLGVVVLSNVGMWASGPVPRAVDVAHAAVEALVPERLGPEYPPEVALDPAVLDRYVGRYRVEAPPPVVAVMGDTLELRREGGRLVASGRQGEVAIFAVSETLFVSRQPPARIEFLPGTGDHDADAILTMMELREFPLRRLP
jgi:D-alanyl-D-alanine carboxypeptidase